ncbi:hypothetical protein DGo_CA1879 [Deinococcus gobiensis I-0]|uniref:Uncharacterized protein n=1 Tax=Deinococcus gobiensis (strain DSM 21396 / JCM 16679 / CGMCC 1.7299 / I-0) TaxID=745776 RepID=H8GX77_DEIGI|nr:hypothetical protein DGo_CA1879 [Deinococcus gobiensis I-0]
MHLQPGETHPYRGFEIYLSDVSRRLVAPYFVTGLKRYCRDVTHGEELIDAHHAALALPREPGSIRVLAADVRVTNSMSAHESRRRSEQARGQKRQGGKFAPERHQQLEQQQAQVAVALTTTPLPVDLGRATEEELGFEPFTVEEIAGIVERANNLCDRAYFNCYGPTPTMDECANPLGDLAGIAEQLLLELGKQSLENEQLRAELAQAKAAKGTRRPKPALDRQDQVCRGCGLTECANTDLCKESWR